LENADRRTTGQNKRGASHFLGIRSWRHGADGPEDREGLFRSRPRSHSPSNDVFSSMVSTTGLSSSHGSRDESCLWATQLTPRVQYVIWPQSLRHVDPDHGA